MTPLQKIDSIFLKREDLNETGSAKDRALSLQIQKLIAKGYKFAVISSTGNAAISAQHYCQLFQIPLTIFLSPHTSPSKLKYLSNYIISSKPISDAIKFSKTNHAYFLRQSTDPVALSGYRQIGIELLKQLPEISSLFIPVGSGTTLLGLSFSLPPTVKLFAVQPASYCPISSQFDKNYFPETTSLTDSLGAKYLPLKIMVLEAIKKSRGGGVVVQNQAVLNTRAYLDKNQIITSFEGALTLAGYQKIANTQNLGTFPVILLTGAKR
jgi:threonine dehydratase